MMRLLVTISSFGIRHDAYLRRLVDEYMSMSFLVDIVVLSNIDKPVPQGVELITGLPSRDPWSLPFAHKAILADRVGAYDLFIYSEDDILVKQSNIEAFLRVAKELKEDEVPGFLRYENLQDGTISYCDVHSHFHWDPGSVVRRGEYTLGFFSNEHAAFYLLRQDQLRRAVNSGGFLVPPHHGKYELAETASTDPYTQCGMKKLICISHLQEFKLHHLPDKYIGTRMTTHESAVRKQLEVLSSLDEKGYSACSLIQAETSLLHGFLSKNYYEGVCPDVVREVPVSAQRILSLGCGSGEMEKWLAKRGAQVTAVCLDPVIAACAQEEGVEILWGDWKSVEENLAGRRLYDCLLISNLLHLVENPGDILRFGEYVKRGGICVVQSPNLANAKFKLGMIAGHRRYRDIGNFKKSGTSAISASLVRRWLDVAGFCVEKTVYRELYKDKLISRRSLRRLHPLFSRDIVLISRKYGC